MSDTYVVTIEVSRIGKTGKGYGTVVEEIEGVGVDFTTLDNAGNYARLLATYADDLTHKLNGEVFDDEEDEDPKLLFFPITNYSR